MGYTGNEYLAWDTKSEEEKMVTIRECVAGCFPHKCFMCGRDLPGKYYEVEVSEDVFLAVGIECVKRFRVV